MIKIQQGDLQRNEVVISGMKKSDRFKLKVIDTAYVIKKNVE